MTESIHLTTTDGQTIAGTLTVPATAAVNQPQVAVLLLHMMPAVKESWLELASALANTGLPSLAIDFRGHGASSGGNYQDFTDQQHQSYYQDVVAAVDLLKQKYPRALTGIVGASIGANLAIRYASINRAQVPVIVSLSAGTDYYGLRAIDDIRQLSDQQSLLLVASKDDVRKSGNSCADMAEQLRAVASSGHTEMQIYPSGGHGTDMYNSHPELIQTIINFINTHGKY